ncbi:MAG: UbiA-like polyprenyltransferase [Bacillota bacterium]|nr:UbiA-like polyprenyltransferase [Bacillota bacterium]
MGRVRTFAELVKFEHSLFALPFAYLGSFLAAGGWPGGRPLLWVTVAMLGARTGAMALNRLIDAPIDARNPRTADRALPAGRLRPSEVLALAAGSFAVLGLAAWQLNRLALELLPLALLTLVVYSYTKRFTWLSHLVLGMADGWAPFGGWVAVAGSVAPLAFLLWALVALWVGAFDILYAAQDLEFDRSHGLHSIPVRFGLRGAFRIARLAHAAVVLLAVAVGYAAGLLGPGPAVAGAGGRLYLAGVAAMAALLAYEHAIVSPDDLSRLDAAFFTVNGWISVTYFLFTAAAVLVA